MEDLVIFENVSVKISNELILKNINWTIKKNCHYAIVGEMGSGKTVLSKSLIGRTHVTEGKIEYLFFTWELRLYRPKQID